MPINHLPKNRKLGDDVNDFECYFDDLLSASCLCITLSGSYFSSLSLGFLSYYFFSFEKKHCAIMH